jgi:hypothetical protein
MTAPDVLVLAGPAAVIVVGGEPSRELTRALRQAIGTGESVETIVAILMSEGLSALPPFGCALREPAGGARVLLRGDFSATVESASGDTSILEAPWARTWTEHFIAAASSVELAPAHGGAAVRIVLTVGAAAPAIPEPSLPGHSSPAEDRVIDLRDAEGAGSMTLSWADPELDQAVLAWGGETISGDRVVTGALLGRLRFAGGLVVDVDQPMLIGRHPDVSDPALAEGRKVVALPDPDQLLSRVHAEIRVIGDALFVVDKGSRNGTSVSGPGAAPRRLVPFEPFRLLPGTTVDLGGVTTFLLDSSNR